MFSIMFLWGCIMDDQYSTGQVSRMLHVSQAKALRWCTEGLIECTTTAGGHYRIPQSAIAAIQKHGEPELPRRSDRASTGRPVSQRNPAPPPSGLYRDASDQLAQSAESVQIVANRIQRRRLELEDAELDDQFEERARRKAAEDAENRRLVAAAEAQRGYQQWLQGKLAYALEPKTVSPNLQLLYLAAGLTPESAAGFPQNAPAQLKQAVHDAVLKLLRNTDRNTLPDGMVNDSIRNTVQTIVRAYNQRQNEIRRAEQEAEQRRQFDHAKATLQVVAALLGGNGPRTAPPPQLAAPPAPQLAAPRPEPTSADAEAEHAAQASRHAAQQDTAEAERKADSALSLVESYLREYFDFDSPLDVYAEARELKDRLRPRLVRLITDGKLMNETHIERWLRNQVESS
jgi:hypothetical protein